MAIVARTTIQTGYGIGNRQVSQVSEIALIHKELKEMREFFSRVIQMVPTFNVTDPKVLPYGLKPHTRSVSWIVEQVIVQQAKYNSADLGAKAVDYDLPDTSLYDCVVDGHDGHRYFVNVKITSAGKKQNKNDIAAVEKLYNQYVADPHFRIIYAVFRFSFNNTEIHFDKDGIHTFSPQFLPIYVNPRNDKIQAYYYADPQERTRSEFLSLLRDKSRSISL
ncbi:MAG: hypothetical protein OXE95_02115 [Chloroflexi bacterium]|nr:hypothetical protein [Chloroflexota bacterium]MCY4246357.1 hypothetical protein [Chloroflexota bacterium]